MRRSSLLQILPWGLLLLTVLTSCAPSLKKITPAPALWLVVGIGVGLLGGIFLATAKKRRR